MDHMMAGIEDVADQQGHHLLRERQAELNQLNLWHIQILVKYSCTLHLEIGLQLLRIILNIFCSRNYPRGLA